MITEKPSHRRELSWHKHGLLVSSTKPWTQIILALVPVVFIHILHTDPFLNFNLSLKVLVSLIKPSYCHLRHGQRQLACFTWCHSHLSLHSHRPSERLMGQPLANCSILPLPCANILKVSFHLNCKSRTTKPHQTSRSYKNKSLVFSLFYCPQGPLAFSGVYLLVASFSALVSF